MGSGVSTLAEAPEMLAQNLAGFRRTLSDEQVFLTAKVLIMVEINRYISTARLKPLLALYLPPINLVFSEESNNET